MPAASALATPHPGQTPTVSQETRLRLMSTMEELQRSGVKRLSRALDDATKAKLVAIGGDEPVWKACFLAAKKARYERGVELFGAVRQMLPAGRVSSIFEELAQNSIYAQANPQLMAKLLCVAAADTAARRLLDGLLVKMADVIDECVRAAARNPGAAAGALTLRMRTATQGEVEGLKATWAALTVSEFGSAPEACAMLQVTALAMEEAIAQALRESSALAIVVPTRLPDDVVPVEQAQLYFIAGWVLHALRKVLRKSRAQCARAALSRIEGCVIEASAAASASLPTSLVDSTTRGGLVYASLAWFTLIRWIEGAYRANLTLAHLAARRGHLITDINDKVVCSLNVRAAFAEALDIESYNHDDPIGDACREEYAVVMMTLLSKFRRMRAKDFRRALRRKGAHKEAAGESTRRTLKVTVKKEKGGEARVTRKTEKAVADKAAAQKRQAKAEKRQAACTSQLAAAVDKLRAATPGAATKLTSPDLDALIQFLDLLKGGKMDERAARLRAPVLRGDRDLRRGTITAPTSRTAQYEPLSASGTVAADIPMPSPRAADSTAIANAKLADDSDSESSASSSSESSSSSDSGSDSE